LITNHVTLQLQECLPRTAAVMEIQEQNEEQR